jgi:RNA polymerase sigma factor for flagellar operon FliA
VAKKLVVKLRNVQLGELIGSGAMGLFNAIERYDPGRNVRFENYAARRIQGAMLDGLRNEDIIPRSYRHRIKLIYKAVSELEQAGVRSPTDGEIRKKLRMKKEAFENTKRVLRSIQQPDVETPVEFQEDVRPSTVEVAAQFKEVMNLARKRLTKIQFKVLAMYYGEDLTLKVIGKSLGLSESRTCQIHAAALFQLRAKLRQRKEQA